MYAQNPCRTKREWAKRLNDKKSCSGRLFSVDDNILKGLSAQNPRLTKEEWTKKLRSVEENILKGSAAQNSCQTK